MAASSENERLVSPKNHHFLKKKKTIGTKPSFLGFQDTVSFRGVVNLRSLEPNGIDPMIMHDL